ncbi:phage tail domain-containing protein [Paenibacillus naphthalenovorans]|uniref:Phage-like protein n=1 Tax=Paenibacillus naphthalenovorans TaxID=162209 RepID=A0A0U2W4H3_9BACL|nr:phage tail domain-containing protein [Paenibacillus naphthalenovorans]ALS22317.1 phage-like protein [Paenibacillus naphthalenovorans]
MKEGIDFYYNGIYSVDMGLINCKIDSGFFEEPFLSERQIKEIIIRGNEKPYFQEVQRSPLEFSLTFAFEDYYDNVRIREVARWLDQDYYRPFYTSDNPERIFYCMLVSDSQLLHNGLKMGYVQVKFRCDSPYSYSPFKTSKIYDWNETPFTFTDNNFSNGELVGVKVNDNGQLILNETKPKWINIPPSTTWNDL